MPDYAISINNLSKQYKTKTGFFNALDSVSFNIETGKIFGLLGPNGAGKSTLINILATTTVKTSGEIKVCGDDFDKNTQKCKMNLGIVPQEVVIDPFFTVRETLDFYAGYFGVRKKDRKTIEILEALSLTDKINTRPRLLSGGMRRRLLIAKALVQNPKVLILDEPTAGVDVELRQQLWDYVNELNKNGTTIILTTHYLEEAENLCDDIAVINQGKIIACDKKENLKKIFGQRELQLEVSKFDKKMLETLNEKYLSAKMQKNNKQYAISITYKYDTLPVEDILAFFSMNKSKIFDIKTNESDLEEIFRKLIN